jgi:peptidylprolyl isomerase
MQGGWIAGAIVPLLAASALAADALPVKPRSLQDVIATTRSSDWRGLDPQNTLYLELAAGRVVIELNPAFAPRHVANIKALVHEHYFDGLAIVRAQDNFVVQWNDPEHSRSLGSAQRTLDPEFSRAAADLAFTALADPDTYAAEVGFADGFPAAREPRTHLAWLVHCYAMVGVGRDDDVDSGNGSELYVVIGQAPRQLDRNVALVGRVVAGMEHLSTLKRGTAALGFYERTEERTPIRSLRLAAEVPEGQRTELEILRTDTRAFADLVEARRNRRDDWYKVPAGRIDVCSVPLVARPRS